MARLRTREVSSFLFACVGIAVAVTACAQTPTDDHRLVAPKNTDSHRTSVPPSTSLARPVDADAVRNTETSISLRPLGSIGYDGQTIPQVSPDGLWIAVQSGQAPPWPAILAQPNAGPCPECAITRYRIDSQAGKLIQHGDVVTGVVLGRGATSDGVLVEIPSEGGGRSIGFLGWQIGEIRALTSDPASAPAHAALTATGGLVFSRLTNERRRELAIRPDAFSENDESTVQLAESSLDWPIPAPDGKGVLAFAESSRGVEVRTFTLASGQFVADGQGALIGTDPMNAYLAAVGVDLCPINGGDRDYLYCDVMRGGIATIAAGSPPSVIGPGSTACAWTPNGTGVLLGAERELQRASWSKTDGIGAPLGVLAGGWIPRRTLNSGLPLVIFGMEKPGRGQKLTVFGAGF